MPIKVLKAKELGTLGVFMCIGVATGDYSNLQIAAESISRTVYKCTPNPAHKDISEQIHTLQRGSIASKVYWKMYRALKYETERKLMKARYDIQLMVQVSKMYYMEGLTQEKIAKQLGISRSAISMILSEAREYGIVQIKIKYPKNNLEEVSKEFIAKFNLKDCLVIPTRIDSQHLITRVVAS